MIKKASNQSSSKSAAKTTSRATAAKKPSAASAAPATKSAAKKTPASKATATKAPAKKAPAPAAESAQAANSNATALAQQIVQEEQGSALLAEQGERLLDERAAISTLAARVIDEVVAQKPEMIVPMVERFATGIASSNKRVVQTCADALPVVAKLAPARVARQLDRLKNSFPRVSEIGKDGLVRTFAALCTASVAYQKRLEPVLTAALAEAEGRSLIRWTEIILPALKGEPHARARAVVEDRLYKIARPLAQKVADFLGIKLRPQIR